MNFEVVKGELKSYGLTLNLELENFVEFFGKIKNSKGVNFEVEGSIEWIKDNKRLVYSIIHTDIDKNKEYDGEIGEFINLEENDIKEKISYILNCDFFNI